METDLDAVVSDCLTQLGQHVVLGLPLGLGKPNRLVNAFYRRACEDCSLQLEIVTALSLNPPVPKSDPERRFLEPFLARHFGEDYPRLEYADDLAVNRLPENVTVSEFYFQSGAMLGNATAQRHYISSNYTHVVRDLLDRGVNLILQLVAARPRDDEREYSLSCNPDLSLDLAEAVRARPDYRCLMVAQPHPELPFMEGDAVVGPDFFDRIVDVNPAQRLFALPRSRVSPQDHAVGLHASALVRDAGTLQVGIGSLSDALVNGLIRRQQANETYRTYFDANVPGIGTVKRVGGTEPLDKGLYGASEMFLDGFMHLYRAGILAREVFDDETTQHLANAGRLATERPGIEGSGALMDAAFFLGSVDFYQWLRELNDRERPRFRMGPVSRINQLYGGSERLEKAQRQGARFINTCMKVDLMGAAVSDGLADHQVVSGVGGQYNFVAMAHAMDDGRSILMLRSTREGSGGRESNIVWQYPHTTIPRHLRDIVVTEYGIADLRGRTDEECAKALILIADSQFQERLREQAVKAGKLDPAWRIPLEARNNTPDALLADDALRRASGGFPDYPFGSDFDPTEQRLIDALQALKALSGSKLKLLRALLAGGPADAEALARMQLDQPRGWRQRLLARLLKWSLAHKQKA